MKISRDISGTQVKEVNKTYNIFGDIISFTIHVEIKIVIDYNNGKPTYHTELGVISGTIDACAETATVVM